MVARTAIAPEELPIGILDSIDRRTILHLAPKEKAKKIRGRRIGTRSKKIFPIHTMNKSFLKTSRSGSPTENLSALLDRMEVENLHC